MKLHEIPKGSQLRLEVNGKVVDATFHHLDGMFSYCTVNDHRDQYFHLYHFQELELIDGKYHLINAND